MAEYMQAAMNPNQQAEEMEFVNQLLGRLNQAHRPGQPGASGDSGFDTAYLGHLQLAGEAVRGVYQSLYVDREFMNKAGCLLVKAEKYGKCLPKDWSAPKHVEWVREFCGSEECKEVLNKTAAEELTKKCKGMKPKAAVEEICGKIQTARQDYVGRVIKFQFGYSLFNFVVVFCECWETCSQLKKFEIHCKGYDERLDNIVARLRDEENKLTEMAINLNQSRAITTMEIYNMLMNLTGIRQELEILKQDLEHNKKDIKRRRNGHISGAAAGFVNVIRAFADYGLATTAGVGTGLVWAAGALNTAATAGHVGTALWCQTDLNMIEERLVRVKEYEERAKNIVRRVESLTQQLRMMYGAPAVQANISARAIPSPVA
ncbi:Hypp1510 [Branchiostoma lanceolatum]|uniref:Hypp1510 protein n=1 Tax=Branchiostoma lanceolatum TaxID=7740 RepID=A0A8J9ZLB7_BRALA|nr:Hypp1510 [Branchiostoma lanceolatum]